MQGMDRSKEHRGCPFLSVKRDSKESKKGHATATSSGPEAFRPIRSCGRPQNGDPWSAFNDSRLAVTSARCLRLDIQLGLPI